ncbi:hypothetical protein [Longispora albida]|uniref:hypothetical protein n=1 Tax=Longispora albida TaxID=203523 RepID=UPI0003698E68|nr:hypothetical protein [Longispora albida]
MSKPEPAGGYTPEPPAIYRPEDSEQPTIYQASKPPASEGDLAVMGHPFLREGGEQATIYVPAGGADSEQSTVNTAGVIQAGAAQDSAAVFPPEQPGVWPVTPPAASTPPAAGKGKPSSVPTTASTPPMYSGPPISGTPVTGYGTAVRLPGRSRATGVLAILCAVFFLIAAVMTGMYFVKAGDAAEAQKKADTVAQKEQKITELTGQLNTAKSDLEKTKQQLAGSQNTGKDLEEQKRVVATCLKLTFQFLDAVTSQDEAKRASAQGILDQMRTPCNQAEPYTK